MDEAEQTLKGDATREGRRETIAKAAIITVLLFIVVVCILSLINGFKSSQKFGSALLGIGMFIFALNTLSMFIRMNRDNGGLNDEAKIHICVQIILLIVFGVGILLVVYSQYHPPELDCYYDNANTYARQNDPICWTPPNGCFPNGCMIYSPTERTTKCGITQYNPGNITCYTNIPTAFPTHSPTQPTPVPFRINNNRQTNNDIIDNSINNDNILNDESLMEEFLPSNNNNNKNNNNANNGD